MTGVAHLETQVGSLACAIYALMQGGKLALPAMCRQLTGWRAVAANLALATVTVLATADPAARFTAQSLVAIALTAASAAGIHGTVSKVSNSATCGTTSEGGE